MTYHSIQLIDYLLKQISISYCSENKNPSYSLVFKMNNELYSGDFATIYNHDHDKPSQEILFPQYFKSHELYQNPYKLIKTETFETDEKSLMDKFFDVENISDITKIYNLPDLYLAKLIDFSNNHVANTNVPKVIFNLKKLYNEEKLDFYFVTDEPFVPVSLIKKER